MTSPVLTDIEREELMASVAQNRCVATPTTSDVEPSAAGLNLANIKRVRDHIAGLPPERFDMGSYFGFVDEDGDLRDVPPDVVGTNLEMVEGTCGSCACIAGHTLVALEPEEESPTAVRPHAAQLLGLSSEDSERLFEPNNAPPPGWTSFSLSGRTASQAVRVLDILMETGEVRWDLALSTTPQPAPEGAPGVGL